MDLTQVRRCWQMEPCGGTVDGVAKQALAMLSHQFSQVVFYKRRKVFIDS
jgi:hypothetical protein